MPRISYPFAALPNQIARGGCGAINVAVLAAILSRGRSTCIAATLAKDVGCDRKSIFQALRYWDENGSKFGVKISKKEGKNNVNILEVLIHRMENPDNVSRTENGTAAVPKTERHAVPKTEHIRRTHKKEPIKRTHCIATPCVAVVKKDEKSKEKDPINTVMEEFQIRLNPTIQYGNKTQRRAVQNLISQLGGTEKIFSMVKFIEQNRDDMYCPVITTPYMLQQKLAQLILFARKQKSKEVPEEDLSVNYRDDLDLRTL